MSSRALALVLLLAASLPVSAAGQDDVVDDEAADGEADAEDAAVPNTAAAAEAYDRGSAFYLNQDYARAAQEARKSAARPTIMTFRMDHPPE